MRHFRFMFVIMLFALLLIAGCSLDALLEETVIQPVSQPKEVASTKPSQKTQTPKPSKKTRPSKPQSELELVPKIDLVTMMSGGSSTIVYFSSAKVPRIIAFYRKEMGKRGWKQGKAQTDNKNYANLRFTKNKELMTISLGADSTSTPPRVLVSLVPHGSLKASSLPRYPGTKTIFEEDFTAIYVTADKSKKVHQWTLKELKKAGWIERQPTTGTKQIFVTALEKGKMELDVQVSVAPAQGNKTTIQYNIRKKLR